MTAVDPAHAREEQEPAADRHEQKRGAEIGLVEREHHREPDHEKRYEHEVRTRYALRRMPLVVAGKRQHERDLHQLRGLEARIAHAEPTPRSA